MKKIFHSVLILAFLFIFFQLSGCANTTSGLAFYEEKPAVIEKSNEKVNVKYLGVGGHLIEWQGERIMTAPSFTNPSLFELMPGRELKSNTALIDKMLPPVDDVGTILVGHAHYDHLLDVPYIMQKHAPRAVVYGSDTVGHIMAAVVDKSRIVAVQSGMADGNQPGQWFYTPSRKIRFMPIKSEHAPHMWGIKVYKGEYAEDLKELPRTANDWVEGQTLAYLIDFLDDKGNIKFRLHYQDAASTAPLGFIPDLAAEDQHRVDLAILCVGGFNEVRGYPNKIIQNTQARHFILGHWEDFFGNNTLKQQSLKVVRMNNIRDFISRVDKFKPADSAVVLPKPMSEMTFSVVSN